MNPVNIQITADTDAAGSKLQAFLANLEKGFKGLQEKINNGLTFNTSNLNAGVAATAPLMEKAAAATTKLNSTLGETQNAGKKIQGIFGDIEKGFKRLSDSFSMGFGIDIARRVNDGLLQIPLFFKNAADSGVKFNAVLEDSRLGIAAVLKQFNPEEYKNFDKALFAAGDAIENLKKKALESPATFKELVGAFQAVSGAATSAGIPLKQQVDLVVLMSQTMAGLGIRSEQIIQESRALLTGNITEDAMVARMLKITAADIKQATDAGKLFEFLTTQLSAFAEAGKRGVDSYTTKLSNLKDALEQTAATAAKPLFESLKKVFDDISEAIQSEGFKSGLKDFMGSLQSFAKPVGDALKWVLENIQLVVDAVKTLAFAALVIAGIGVALKGISFFSALAGIQAVSVATMALLPAGAGVAVQLGRHIGSLALIFDDLTSAIGVAGAALAGWEIGNLVGELDAFGLKIKQWMQLSWLGVFDVWERIKAYLSGTGNWIAGTLRISWHEIAADAKRAFLSILQSYNQIPLVPKINTDPLLKSLVESEKSAQEARLKRDAEFADAKIKSTADLKQKLKAIEAAEGLVTDSGREPDKGDPTQKKAEFEGKKIGRPVDKADVVSKLEEINKAYREAAGFKLDLLHEEYDKEREFVQKSVKDALAREMAITQLNGIEAQKAKEIRDEEKDAIDKRMNDFMDSNEHANMENLKNDKDYLSRRLVMIRQHREEVDLDRSLSPSEKRNQKIESLKDELNLLEQMSAYWKEKMKTAEGDQQELLIQQELNQLKQEELGIMREIDGLRDPGFFETLRNGVDNLATTWNNFGKNAANVLTNGIGTAVQGVTDQIMASIEGTANWGKMFAQVGRAIVSELIKVVVQWVVAQAIRVGAHLAGETAMTAATAAGSTTRTSFGLIEVGRWIVATAAKVISFVAGESTMTAASLLGYAIRLPMILLEAGKWLVSAAMKAAAAVADVPYVGPILAIAAIGAVITAGMAAMGAFAEGGYTGPGGKYEAAGVVHKGEVVFSQADVARIGLPTIMAFRHSGTEAMTQGLMTAANLVNTVPQSIAAPIDDYNSSMALQQVTGGRSAGAAPTAGGQPAGSHQTVKVGVFDDRSNLKQFFSSSEGRAILLEINKDQQLELGHRS